MFAPALFWSAMFVVGKSCYGKWQKAGKQKQRFLYARNMSACKQPGVIATVTAGVQH